ncbi:hypothetical protein BDP27DRAFT_534049 [Rhodocollybia butyracea]|uniref:Uncharacterized protein n=1 Tax=Rhodocollybia butyracea TaxID=206335 RepID=A0A9P5U9N9_9AGAR|nr:hypothetical protein BDP27DRAFT_534049 [Rhodocollybia butyracea]
MAILRKSLPNATIPDLQLVTSIFECTECKEGMYYPEMFHHKCCCEQVAVVSRTGEPLDYYLPNCLDYHWPNRQVWGHWTSQKIIFSIRRSKFAKRIVQACGLDPNTTTCTNSRLSHALIECLSCNEETPKQRRRCFMRWRCAVLGVHSEHLLKFDSFGQDITQILAAEQNQYDSWALNWVHYFARDIQNRPDIRCSHCHKSIGLHSKGVTLSEVQTHLQTDGCGFCFWHRRTRRRLVLGSSRSQFIMLPTVLVYDLRGGSTMWMLTKVQNRRHSLIHMFNFIVNKFQRINEFYYRI